MMFIRPAEIINLLSQNFFLKPGDKIAEFGCGAGYFTLLLAEKVGPQGRVYAIDILADALEETKELIQFYGYNNVSFLKSDVKNLPFEDSSFDVVYISQLLFQNEGYDKILTEGLRILKPGGCLIILEPGKKISFIEGTPVGLDILKTFFEVRGKKINFEKRFDDNYYLIVVVK